MPSTTELRDAFAYHRGVVSAPIRAADALAQAHTDAAAGRKRYGAPEAGYLSRQDDGDPSTPLGYLKAEHAKGRTLADIIEELSIGDASALAPYVEEAGPDHEAMAELPIPFSPPSAADALAQIAARLRGENADPHSDLESDIAAIVRAAQGKEG